MGFEVKGVKKRGLEVNDDGDKEELEWMKGEREGIKGRWCGGGRFGRGRGHGRDEDGDGDVEVNVDTVGVGRGPALRPKKVLGSQSTRIIVRKRDYPFYVRCQKI